jgi:hypothetical protein
MLALRGGSWLTASPKTGTVTKSARTITFEVNSSAHSLHPNTYVNSISFNNTTNSQGNTTRVATLIVNPKEYTITVRGSPSADGSVSGGGTFPEGTSHTVTATPNTGDTFVHWTENGRVVSTSESYTFTLPMTGDTVASAPSRMRSRAATLLGNLACTRSEARRLSIRSPKPPMAIDTRSATPNTSIDIFWTRPQFARSKGIVFLQGIVAAFVNVVADSRKSQRCERIETTGDSCRRAGET